MSVQFLQYSTGCPKPSVGGEVSSSRRGVEDKSEMLKEESKGWRITGEGTIEVVIENDTGAIEVREDDAKDRN